MSLRIESVVAAHSPRLVLRCTEHCGALLLCSLEAGIDIVDNDGDGMGQQWPGPPAPSSKCGARSRIHDVKSSSWPEIITTPPSGALSRAVRLSSPRSNRFTSVNPKTRHSRRAPRRDPRSSYEAPPSVGDAFHPVRVAQNVLCVQAEVWQQVPKWPTYPDGELGHSFGTAVRFP